MERSSKNASTAAPGSLRGGDVAGDGQGTPLELTIDSIAYGGSGVGRDAGGRVIFAPWTAPGDRVFVRLTREHPRHAEATVERWLERASDRADPFCPYFTHCGGCHLQHLQRVAQLDWKQTVGRDLLSRLGGVGDPDVSAIPPPRLDRGYRCHAQFAVAFAGHTPRIGFRAATGESVVDIKTCPLLAPLLNSRLASARDWLRDRAGALHEKRRHSWLRWLDIRANAAGEECTVVLWCHSIPREEIASLTEHLRNAESTLRGVRVVRCRGRGRRPGGRAIDFLAPGHIVETAGDRFLRVSALSFYQANPGEAQRLIEAAWQLAGPDESRFVVELYAGAGFFTTRLAASVGHVVAVESSPSAARDLRWNMRESKARSITVRQGDAAAELRKLLASGRPRPDQVWVNPPRGGMDRGAVEAVAEAGPGSIVYVSCDPATLSRDVRRLIRKGYALVEARPFDLFPHTYHVETVALLRRMAIPGESG